MYCLRNAMTGMNSPMNPKRMRLGFVFLIVGVSVMSILVVTLQRPTVLFKVIAGINGALTIIELVRLGLTAGKWGDDPPASGAGQRGHGSTSDK